MQQFRLLAPNASKGERRLDKTMWLLGLVGGLTLILAILWAHAPWLHDFAEWLFQARILALKASAPELVEAYELAPYPVPNSLAIVLLAIPTSVMPALWAGKLYIGLQILAWLWLLKVYAERFAPVGSQGAVFLVLTSIAAFSTFFWYGFISYQLGLWVFFLFLLSCDRKSPAWKLALFGVLLFLCHAMVALVWGLVVLAWAISESRDRGSPIEVSHFVIRCVPLLPATGLVLWYLAGRLAADAASAPLDAQMSGIWESIQYKVGYPLMIGSFRNILLESGRAVFENWPAIYLIGALCNVTLVGILGVWSIVVLVASGSAMFQRRLPANQQGLAWSLLAVAALYLVAPYDLLGLLNPAGRLLLPFLAIGLLIAPGRTIVLWRWAALPAAVGLSITLAGYLGLIALGPAAHRDQPFLSNARTSSGSSVFQFNDGLYPNTGFPYFNYRVLVSGRRFEQLDKGELSGLGFRTGPIIAYDPRR